MFIYCITNKVNGKQYVGLTTRSIKRRFMEHIWEAKSLKSNFGSVLNKAIRKYGQFAFDVTMLEECSKEYLSAREQYWIRKVNAMVPYGYNLTSGGEAGYQLSIQSIRSLKDHQCKVYYLKSPAGKLYQIKGLVDFAKKNDLDRACLSKVSNGQRMSHRGWTKLSETEIAQNNLICLTGYLES